jgi:hypothetical protein
MPGLKQRFHAKSRFVSTLVIFLFCFSIINEFSSLCYFFDAVFKFHLTDNVVINQAHKSHWHIKSYIPISPLDAEKINVSILSSCALSN